MKFGSVDVAESVGGIVVHTVRRDGLVLKKGHRVKAANVAALKKAGVEKIVVARLDDGDVAEDKAAGLLAKAIAGSNVRVEKPFTGRSNLFSKVDGVLRVDPQAIDAINDVDAAITVATLPLWRAVVAGEMIGTVKIIPFAVQGDALDASVAAGKADVVSVSAYQRMRIGVVSTVLPGLKESTVTKTLKILQQRIAPTPAMIVGDERLPHDTSELANAITAMAQKSDIVIIFGASAITDRRDVIPAALEQAGGTIEHFGMPVDPGNLLLVGRIKSDKRVVHVLGAPGCARSPKENGFDWVLQRLLAGIPVTAKDIKKLGVGGLLMEIVQRGQLRDGSGDG